jgi:23S rRNA pseudouridine2457 synthase
VDQSSFETILFWKPYGVLSQFTPEPGSRWRTLAEFIPIKNVYAAGRLDADSEGLLILTSDGALQRALTDPKSKTTRTYWVQVEGVPSEDALRQLRQGVMVLGTRTRSARVKALDGEPDLPPREPSIRFRKSIPTAWLEMELIEGRNRQVRRMTAAAGYPALRVVRVRHGRYDLAGLAPGLWRPAEI